MALGDLDGDSDLDAVVANTFFVEAETVWLNDGTGAFSAHSTIPSFVDWDSFDVALGDLDGDSDLDAVVANSLVLPELVWLNDGTGIFAAHHTTPSFGGGYSTGVALGDLDGDSDLDAVVANGSGEAETVWLNDGTGTFTPHPSTPSFGTGDSYDVALGDLDGDSDLDAVVANYIGEPETVWLNDGPAAVQLAGFQATAEADHVRVMWETVSELDNQGFNLYRSTSSDAAQATRLNAALMPSQGPNSSEGFTYEWNDLNVERGVTYYYWLEDVDTGGNTHRTGPVSVTLQAPTAITVSTLAASRANPALGWQAGAAGLALVGLGAWRRRA